MILLKGPKPKRNHKEAHNDFNTKQVKEEIEQIASLFSDLVVKYVQEAECAGIAAIEQGMTQMVH